MNRTLAFLSHNAWWLGLIPVAIFGPIGFILLPVWLTICVIADKQEKRLREDSEPIQLPIRRNAHEIESLRRIRHRQPTLLERLRAFDAAHRTQTGGSAPQHPKGL